MKCSHPNKPENLKNGKCGTCEMAKDFRNQAKDLPHEKVIQKCLIQLAEAFERGDLIFDSKNGKSLLEIESNKAKT